MAYDVHLTGFAFAAAYHFLGWNFGRITPSLGWFGSLQKKAKRWTGSKPNLRIHQPDDFPSYRELDEQADRILAKLHEHGDTALTAQEHQILEDYSRRMRQKLR